MYDKNYRPLIVLEIRDSLSWLTRMSWRKNFTLLAYLSYLSIVFYANYSPALANNNPKWIKYESAQFVPNKFDISQTDVFDKIHFPGVLRFVYKSSSPNFSASTIRQYVNCTRTSSLITHQRVSPTNDPLFIQYQRLISNSPLDNLTIAFPLAPFRN